jgi:hypothetical protein
MVSAQESKLCAQRILYRHPEVGGSFRGMETTQPDAAGSLEVLIGVLEDAGNLAKVPRPSQSFCIR